MRATILLITLLGIATPASARPTPARRTVGSGMARIPAGYFRPLYAAAGQDRERVASFLLDREPVTKAEFLDFVRNAPEWRRSTVRRVFAERSYLADWRGDLDAGPGAIGRSAVTNVSWFAARAFCEARGRRLPTTNEWEYAAAASETRRHPHSDATFTQRLLSLYQRRSTSQAAMLGAGFRNVFGVSDLHGVVWEWTQDFNATVITDDSRASGGGVDARDHHLFCASAAIGATDLTDYPAFLRYAVRSGLTGRSTTSGLGFRCAAGVVA